MSFATHQVHATFPAAAHRAARLALAAAAALTVAVLTGLATPRARAADSMAPVEKYLSADTLLLARMPDVAESRKRWTETAVGRAWADPGVAYWRSMQFDPALASLLGRAGLKGLPALLDKVQGQVFLAAEAGPGAPASRTAGTAKPAAEPTAQANVPVVVYLGVDFALQGSDADAVRAQLAPADAKREPTPEGLRASVPEIVVHPAPLPGATSVCSAWVGSTWLAASSREALLDLLARRYGAKLPGVPAPDRPPLRSNDAWKRLAEEAPAKADVTVYADNARLYEILADSLHRSMGQLGDPAQSKRIDALLDAAGLPALGQSFASTEMRGKAFYTRQVVTFRGEPKGLAFVTNPDRPLKTPEWMTRDLDSFSAVSVRSPLGFKQEVVSLVQQLAPDVAPMLANLENSFKAKAGVPLDDLLGSFGSEVATASRPGLTGLPDMALLWEIRDAPLLRKTLQSVRNAFGIVPSQLSYGGYPYESQIVAPLPIPIFTSEIDGYFLLSTSDTWLKNMVDFRAARASAKDTAPKDAPQPAASTPLLPLLDEPFGPAPRDMAVVERAYSNPGPSLLQLNTYLPILVPIVNMQLQAANTPQIPAWVVSAIPPLLPFATQAFPTITRTEQDKKRVITETYSAFDPIQTPVVATAAVILNSYLNAPPEVPAPSSTTVSPALRPGPAIPMQPRPAK